MLAVKLISEIQLIGRATLGSDSSEVLMDT